MADVTPAPPTLPVSTAVTPTDHSKLVELAAWLCMVVGILATLARVQIRWPLVRGLAGTDDYLCGVAMIFAVIQSAIAIQASRDGFGRTVLELDPGQEVSLARIIYATDLLFMISIWLGRVSIATLLTRLAGESNKSKICRGFAIATSVLGLVAFLTVAIRQDVSSPWLLTSGTLGSTDARWLTVGILAIVTDLAAMVISWYLVHDLQMGSQPKTLVTTAFALRAISIPPIALRLVALSKVSPNDFSFSYALPEIYTQLEMHVNLIATTLPCLRLFLSAWNSNFMNMGLEELDPQAYQQHVSSEHRSYAMNSIKRSNGSAGMSKQHSNNVWVSGSIHGRSTAIVETGRRDEDAASDKSTRAIVVKQTFQVD